MAPKRYHFVDLLRGWAVFVMIETHVVNALLLPAIKDQTFFKVLTFFNGLVAPTFLFCAGFGLSISLSKKWDQFIRFEKPFWRYLQRLGFILVVGYSLHMPFFSLGKLLELRDQASWISFYQIDILQTISLTLAFLVLLAVAARKEPVFLLAAAVIGTFVVFSAPVVRPLDYSGWSAWIRPLFTTAYKSQFPLFPWSSFLIAGMLIGYLFVKKDAEEGGASFMKRLGLLSIAGIAAALLFEVIPFGLYPGHDFWMASPEFFFVRLGLVTLFLYGLWKFGEKKSLSGRSVFSLFGQESLIVYVVHLLIVYGYTYPWSFVRHFGPNLDYAGCLGLFLLLAAGMYALAYFWHLLKEWNAKVAKRVQFVWLAGVVLLFILR